MDACDTPPALTPEAAAELETLAGQVRGWERKIRNTAHTLRTQRQFLEQARYCLQQGGAPARAGGLPHRAGALWGGVAVNRVTKSTLDRYDVRAERSWAVIGIGDAGGVFVAESDYGNYGHCWPYHGRSSFRKFLLEVHDDYLLRKISQERWFDVDASVAKLKAAIELAVKEESRVIPWNGKGRTVTFDAEMAEEATAQLDELGGCNSFDSFYHVVTAHDEFNVITQDSFWYEGVIVTDHPPDARGFVQHIWPVFMAELRRELAVTPAPRFCRSARPFRRARA